MGFWDRDVENSFDRLFDFNRDGTLDPAEQALQYDFINGQLEEEWSDAEIDSEEEDSLDDELDLDDLEYMDEDERCEALEDAGYDPYDFDVDF